MANQEHLAKLDEGVAAWNQWRNNHRDIIPDLIDADLSHKDLSHMDLSRADLIDVELRHADLTCTKLNRADLRRANLIEASLVNADLIEASLVDTDLSHAKLSHADLSSANLRRATLRNVDLIHTRLSNADLQGTNLSNVNLSYANLSGANLHSTTFHSTILHNAILHSAILAYTTFVDINLSEVKDLDTIQHRGPSYISIDSIYHSHGNIPEIFLKGAGIDDTFISYIQALVNTSPIQYYSCFISYSSKDETFAKRLYADLQSHNVRCWFAPEDIKIGDHYHQRIDDSIRLYEKLILILSEHAVQSAWVEREVVAAREKEDHKQQQVLFPIRLDDAVMNTPKAWAADVRRRWHIGDLTRWKDHDAYQLAFTRLLRDLKAQSS